MSSRRNKVWASGLVGLAMACPGPVLRADPVADAAARTNAAPSADAAVALKRLRVADGLRVEAWATEPLVENLTSLDFDAAGRAYVVETGRRRTSVFDIRNFKDWVEDDLSLRTVPDRVAFLGGMLSTNAAFLEAATRNKPRGFGDFNRDGVVDVRDLAVESERIRVVWDSDGDGRADRSAVHADGFDSVVSGVAAGVMVAGTNVWFACIPDIWRLPAAGAEPKPVAKGAPLLSGFGVHVAYGGHDLHGLTMGPDGRVYFSIADRGSWVTNREGVVISEPDTGAVFRCEPDGSGLEVFARGLRNPQELAFDDLGNLWTADNNGDGGDKARWTLLLPRSEHGWTIGWQWLPKMGAWNSERLWQTASTNTALYLVPPVAHVGHGPAGIAFYPGTGLGPRFERHFFYADFPGGVRHFRVEPEGAFYRVARAGAWMEDNKAERTEGKLLWELYPVDVAFPPGGGVVVADWVEGWEKTGKGRLWKVTDPALAADPLIRETAQFLAEGMGGRAEGQLMLLLGHADLRVRQEAQFELARRDVRVWDGLLATARAGINPEARRHALRAMAQIVRAHPGVGDLYDELRAALRFLDDPDVAVAVEACRLMAEARFAPAQGRLRALFKHPSPRVVAEAILAEAALFQSFVDGRAIRDRESAGEKIYASAPRFARKWMPAPDQAGAVSWPIAELRDALVRAGGRDPVITHAATRLVHDIVAVNTSTLFPGMVALMRHSEPHVRLPVLLAERRLRMPEVVSFLEDPDPRLSLEAARAIHDEGIASGYGELIRYLDTGLPKAAEANVSAAGRYPFSAVEWRTYFLRRSVNAAFRRGSSEDLPVLSRAAANAELPETVRVEALESLRDWARPPRRDRITGLILPLASREAAPAWAALSDAWRAATSASAPEAVVLAAIEAARTLGWPEGPARVAALASHASPAVRKAAVPPRVAADPADARPVGASPADTATLLKGGDAARGRKLFAERADWGCQRCHKLGGEGGDVGPDLTGLGRRLSREQILEAILYPNRSIAAGYESVLVTLDDGETVVGVVRGEAGGKLLLDTPAEGRVEIPVARVKSRERAPSAMPDGLGEMMTRGEVRDLIEALGK